MGLYCELESMKTESDVEQKFIYPLLHTDPPVGLGIKNTEIFTKNYLRQKLIDKGQKAKYYIPDYLVSIRGIPILIVEAKAPTEDLAQGFHEARLYAQEVNASYPHNLNICQIVIACNGKETWIGFSDQAEPTAKLKYDEYSTECKSFCDFLSLCSRKRLFDIANRYYLKSRGGSRFDSPVAQLGGKRVQNEEMEANSFGRTLVFENRTIFDPESEEDRTNIVKNAYVHSPKREQHIEPIFKEIRRFELPSIDRNATLLSTDSPDELVGKLSEKIINNQAAYSLMLLIGNVGSGKTTFTRYFKDVFLISKQPVIASKCEWVFLNMNSAPVSKNDIYPWIQNNIIHSIKNEHADVEFDSYEVVQKIFHKEITLFDKGIGSLLKSDEKEYNKELYTLLKEKSQDVSLYLEALLYYIKLYYSKTPIIVLDNCDKRTKEEQLLMFEVAQWLRTQYKCIVILPMRDSTYDMYKSEPPLDTVVRDLVFRIDPPDLLKVLQARLDYIMRITDQTGSTYVLQNGIKVAVKRSELLEYFKLIMVAIRNDRWISNIFYRLTNKNIRNGIQIFEDFCKSGHMKTEDILSIRVLGENSNIPTYRFENVLLRKNRRYYSGDESNFVNLFASDYADDFPDPFVRVDILYWLFSLKTVEGPTGDKGFFPVSMLLSCMHMEGHKIEVVNRELDYLIKRGLVFCDSLVGVTSENDLIKISIPGALHIKMLSNVQYLAACSEDTLFKNSEIMMRISNRLKIRDVNTKLISALNAKDLVDYLIDYRKVYLSDGGELLTEKIQLNPYNMDLSKKAVEKWIQDDPSISKTIDKITKFKNGMQVEGIVVSKRNGGVVCTIANEDVKGFLSSYGDKYNFSTETYNDIAVGDVLLCLIIDFDIEHGSFQLKYLSRG